MHARCYSPPGGGVITNVFDHLLLSCVWKSDTAELARHFNHGLLYRESLCRRASDIAMQTRFCLYKLLKVNGSFDRPSMTGYNPIGEFRGERVDDCGSAIAALPSSTVLEPIVPPELLPK